MRYQVALCERQFNRVDPDNRLVAAELEQRWENSLRELKLAKAAYARQKPHKSATHLSAELKTALSAIGQKLPELWQGDTSSKLY